MRGRRGVSRPTDRLIAVDGVNGSAMLAAARSAGRAADSGARRHQPLGRLGIFGEVVVADDAAGQPSARTLLLLYAADLAFRLRWEIRPALAEGLVGRRRALRRHGDRVRPRGRDSMRTGSTDLFGFAPRPAIRRLVTAPAARSISDRKGFVEFGCQQIAGSHGPPRRLLIRRTGMNLRAMTRRKASIGSGEPPARRRVEMLRTESANDELNSRMPRRRESGSARCLPHVPESR